MSSCCLLASSTSPKMGGVFDLVFFEWPALWSALFCLLWFPMGSESSSLRSTSLLFGLCSDPLKTGSKITVGVSSSSEEELVAPALPLIALFGWVGVPGLRGLDPGCESNLLLPLL